MPTSGSATRARPRGQQPKGPIDPALGQRIRTLRAARGLSQAELAGADFSKGFISLLETGRTRISLRAADILARRLGVTTSDLIGAAASTDQRQVELNGLRAEQELAAGRPELALEAVEASLPRAEGVLRARFLRLRGRALMALGKVRDALGPLDESLRLFRATGQNDLLTRAMFDLALAHGQLDAPGEAMNLALEAERRLNAGDLVDRTLELQILNFVSNMFVRTGDFASADIRAERALKLARDISDPDTLGRLYSGLSITRQEQGDFEAALVYARKSLEVYERMQQDRRVAETWNNIGWLYAQRSFYGRAEEALDRAERLAAQGKFTSLQALITATRAELELARGRPAKAEALAAQAAASPDATGYTRANALWIQAQAVAASKAPLARVRAVYGAALTAFEDQPRRMRARLHESYAEVLKKRGQPADALEHYEHALKLLGPSLP